MFKELFNELSISIKKFILVEKNRPTFENVNDQIKYYKSVVDDYLYIQSMLENIILEIDNIKFPDLYAYINKSLNDLNDTFEKYKTEFIVTAYLDEINNFNNQTTLYEMIYKFEKSLINKPIIKIDNDTIQDILVYVKEYVNNSNTYYFFSNNPFEIDETYGIVIPVKHEYPSIATFTTAIYNYLNDLLTIYNDINSTELIQLDQLELVIKEKIFVFNELIRLSTKNKYYPEYGTTPDEFMIEVSKIIGELETKINEILELGVYRFYSLSKQFKEIEENFQGIKEYYYNNSLYIEYQNNFNYNRKLTELHEIISLLEDGKIDISKDYILTDNNIKVLVDNIIELSREYKKPIYYTEKYNVSGMSTDLVFEFYQTDLFLSSIKKYYYELMTQHIYRYSIITIDDYGDSTVTELKNKYKLNLSKYNAFISQELYFLNEFEIIEHIKNIEQMQIILKKIAMDFFDASLKTSPSTYQETIENQYKIFKEKLITDIEYFKLKNIDVITLNVDKNRDEALKNLRNIERHINSIEHIIALSNKYVFLNMTDFINTHLYNDFNIFYLNLKESFDKQEYLLVINDFKNFYETTIFDFNMLYSLEKLAETMEIVFNKINEISTIFIDLQTTKIPLPQDNEYITFMDDLFGDETYKVLRSELYSQLDNFYEFVISVRQNEKPFLVNEKNIKKAYFDNQLVKLNYINIYNRLLSISSTINSFEIAELNEFIWFQNEIEKIESFDYIENLDALILNQNRILADISKIIYEYGSDNNFVNAISTETISTIEDYNKSMILTIIEYEETVLKISNMINYEKTKKSRENLVKEHTIQWNTIVNDNNIKAPIKISYNEMDTFTGNIPFLVEFEAKVESVNVIGDNIDIPTFIWDFGDTIIEGKKVSYTFFKEGLQSVRCEMKYSSGEISTKFIEFDISGPTNSQVVKTDRIEYSPIRQLLKQPKLTYFDEETQTQITVPLNVSGNVLDMVSDGSISVSESDQDLLVEKIGLVVLGFNGVEFAGEKFDQSQIFGEEFELPEEAEFLFDFKVSDPVVNKSVINISDSKFVEYITKVPKTKAISPYQIEDASYFQENSGSTLEIIEGDMVIMKNKMNRYIVVEIESIKEITDIESQTYYFKIDFNYHVNISLNIFEQKSFKPKETSLTVPTLMFKTDIKELFNTLIVKLESINSLKEELKITTDIEAKVVLENKIENLEFENKQFYIFEEYNKLNAKLNSLKSIYKKLDKFGVEYNSLNASEIEILNTEFKEELDNTKTFYEYINGINVYEFRKNIVDLEILISMYQEQKDIMDILFDTYNFKDYEINHFINKIDNLRYFGESNNIEFSSNTYIAQIINIVKIMREYLYKLKLVINYPIMTEGKYIILSKEYERLFFDSINNEYKHVSETDLYLLNKKLELIYGYETGKVEDGFMYEPFVMDITTILKDKFGHGLNNNDLVELSNYIKVVEDRTVEEYDDFFMIPFWIDYLEKLN